MYVRAVLGFTVFVATHAPPVNACVSGHDTDDDDDDDNDMWNDSDDVGDDD